MSTERIEWLLGRLRETAAPPTFVLVEELVQHLLEVYGSGIAQILSHVSERGAMSEPLERALVDDPLVSALLTLHGLHPGDLKARVEGALERVRPQLAAHGGGVTLLGVDEHRIVHLQLAGSCNGCPSSRATLHQLIEQAVLEAAPEVAGLEVQPAATPPQRRLPLVEIARGAS